MTVQIVEIAGQKIAMLPIEDYQRLVDIAEDKADAAAAADAETRRNEGEDYVPSEVVDQICSGVNPVRVWRKYRNLKQKDLGQMVGCSAAHISQIENEERQASAVLWRKLADALNVSVDDLMPVSDDD
ncbi:helix-turn-helix transcriptional regulator [Sphingobium sp.]|uniref:helix-turn-helix transcriptional regulator n=1 Tax=Sphingobium sp. TaxID=1912891 RepID=UPI002628A02B|nr:helix-turn-helix transcriptional regulator [Sphingobium sp.]